MAENTQSGVHTDNLSSLIQNTVTSLQMNVICEKAARIQQAIVACLKILLGKVAIEEPLFRISELIQVGSFAEGTKLLQPDEFDFLAVIGELSEPDAIAVDNNPEKVKAETYLPESGYVTVAIADDNLKTRWEKYYDNGLLQCFQDAYKSNRVRFGNIFINAILKLYKENVSSKREDRVITCSATEIDFLNCALGMTPVNDISLNLRRAEIKTPNVLIDFELDNRQRISVDLSPAIRYHRIEDCFKVDDCAGSVLSEAILNRGSLLLVANWDFYFRVTVTETEVQYIQSVMRVEHKVIYIFLKYINNSLTERKKGWHPFSSYMLKNMCLKHDLNCKMDKITVASCFEKVVEELIACCSNFELASVVNSKLNLFRTQFWGHNMMYQELEYREYMFDAIKKTCQQSKDIHSVEEFKDFLNHLFDETIDRFNAMRDEKYFNFTDDYQAPEINYEQLYSQKS